MPYDGCDESSCRASAARTSCSTPAIPSTGIRGATRRSRARRENKADLSVDRLLDLPLVPRHGARVVREPGDRRGCSTRDFVSIKVDREERPDVDRVYMSFVQATTGSGGWPMTVFLTPELKPFFGGTYFPPTSRWGRPGFSDLLGELARVWSDDRAQGRRRGGRAARPAASR